MLRLVVNVYVHVINRNVELIRLLKVNGRNSAFNRKINIILNDDQ